MRVLSVVGARPQFVKAFPVSNALREDHDEVLVHTGQHYDEEMNDVFFEELPIPDPDHNLGVGSDAHAPQTAAMMQGIDELVTEHDPDTVLVYGDTNSTLAGALVGAKRDTSLAHVEAGLRSYDPTMPEEVNRVLTDHAADVLCTPSERADRNLEEEGITDGVVRTGDVMYDALLYAREHALSESTVLDRGELGYADGEYVLATIHRVRNTDDPARLASIVSALVDTSWPVVFPVHPRTRKALDREGLLVGLEAADGVDLIDPVGYLDFLRLADGADRIVTDSGGVQKEAFYLDTPCVTLRPETEWTETVEAGWNVLAGTDREEIHDALNRSFDRSVKPEPYGDGDAASAIVAALERAA